MRRLRRRFDIVNSKRQPLAPSYIDVERDTDTLAAADIDVLVAILVCFLGFFRKWKLYAGNHAGSGFTLRISQHLG